MPLRETFGAIMPIIYLNTSWKQASSVTLIQFTSKKFLVNAINSLLRKESAFCYKMLGYKSDMTCHIQQFSVFSLLSFPFLLSTSLFFLGSVLQAALFCCQAMPQISYSLSHSVSEVRVIKVSPDFSHSGSGGWLMSGCYCVILPSSP